MNDAVNHPTHYASGEIECIDAMKASMSKEAFYGFLKGNVLKYMWRYEKKVAPAEDLKKAEWYLNELIEEMGKTTGTEHNNAIKAVQCKDCEFLGDEVINGVYKCKNKNNYLNYNVEGYMKCGLNDSCNFGVKRTGDN